MNNTVTDMRYFDLHCDTLFECNKRDVGLKNNNLHIDLTKNNMKPYIQCFATWIPSEYKGITAFEYFCQLASVLTSLNNTGEVCHIRNKADFDRVERDNIVGGILTIENSSAFGGKIENVKVAADLGVKIASLTWNGNNEVGAGVGGTEGLGLTDYGRALLTEMNAYGITVDLSHASEQLFWETCEAVDGPMVASHSNSFELCSHRRNLKKEQFNEICNRNGLVGLNFYKAFLENDENRASMESIFNHADYFLGINSNSKNILAMGSDFDGSDIPWDMNGIQSMEELYNIFLAHNYSQELVDKIFYKNARNFLYNKF